MRNFILFESVGEHLYDIAITATRISAYCVSVRPAITWTRVQKENCRDCLQSTNKYLPVKLEYGNREFTLNYSPFVCYGSKIMTTVEGNDI